MIKHKLNEALHGSVYTCYQIINPVLIISKFVFLQTIKYSNFEVILFINNFKHKCFQIGLF